MLNERRVVLCDDPEKQGLSGPVALVAQRASLRLGRPRWCRSRHKDVLGIRYSSEAYPFSRMHTYLKQIFDSFGPHRMFWGTDITKMPCSWRQCITMFTGELPWLGGEDKALVMGEAICAWWGWGQESLARRVTRVRVE